MILLTCDKDSSLMDIFLEHLEYIFFSCEGGSAGQGFWSWSASLSISEMSGRVT